MSSSSPGLTLAQYPFAQGVMERTASAVDVTEAPAQSAWFKT